MEVVILSSVVQIIPKNEDDVMKAIEVVMGHPSMKQVVVVDEDIDISDRKEWSGHL